MPILASLKIAALATALICIGIGPPQSDRDDGHRGKRIVTHPAALPPLLRLRPDRPTGSGQPPNRLERLDVLDR
jgi:hypothetical protein